MQNQNKDFSCNIQKTINIRVAQAVRTWASLAMLDMYLHMKLWCLLCENHGEWVRGRWIKRDMRVCDLPAVDPWDCKAMLDLHQHHSLDGAWQALDRFTPRLIYRLQPLHGLSWCCHCVCRCTEAAISPISLIIAVYCQLVFYPTVNTDKYHRAAQPSRLPPTQYFWLAIRSPGHVLLRFNRLIWINSHLSGSRGSGSINIQLHCGCFLKMEPAFQQYVFCHAIHSAHTPALVEESISLWLDNKTISLSPPGSRQSNSNCTKLHIPQSGKERVAQNER